MKNDFTRREFLTTTAKGAAFVSAVGVYNSCKSSRETETDQVPKRVLGKTGMEVSILSFGGGSQFLKNKNGDWEKLLEASINSGINLYDTSPDYTVVSRDGSKAFTSEERFGEILPAYRDRVFITTKLNDRVSGFARKTVEESLVKMKTGYIDILLMHAINEKDSLAEIEDGVYKEMVEMKNEGIANHIGFSSMDSAERSKELLENLEIDVVEMALNPTVYGDYPGIAFPVAIEKNVGIIAMKVMRDIVGKAAEAKELFEYAWSQEGVASSLVGHFGLDILKENIGLAIGYGKEKVVNIDREELESRLTPYAGPHALCWARPDYRDGGIVV